MAALQADVWLGDSLGEMALYYTLSELALLGGSFEALGGQNLIEAAALMEANLEEPLSLDEIAALVGVSRRQIERLFKRYVGEVPTKYYLDMRLRRARGLLLQTAMSIMDIAVACGFQSPPHFSKCYRNMFGHTPSAERQNSRRGVLQPTSPEH